MALTPVFYTHVPRLTFGIIWPGPAPSRPSDAGSGRLADGGLVADVHRERGRRLVRHEA
jgi:hypothetical protein